MVEPRLIPLNIGFAGVACPGVVEANKGPPPVAPEVGVEPVPGAFPVLAPNKLAPGCAPPNIPPPVEPRVEPPAAVVVGVLEGPPNMLDEPGLAPPNRLPPAVPDGADGVVVGPPKDGVPDGGVPVVLPPPNRPPAGLDALLLPMLPNRPPPLPPPAAWPPPVALLLCVLPNEKPLPDPGVEDCALPKMFDGAAVDDEVGAEVPGAPPPKLNDMIDEDICWVE